MPAIILFLLLIFSTSIAKAQQTNSSISLGSSLSPIKNSHWLSNSGQFAFGFYPFGKGFSLGIWVDNIQQKTVVWTANRDDPPLSGEAKLLLDNNGNLILQQNQSSSKPNANVAESAASASLLDSGNLVLYNSDSKIIWQSFDYPTDTILPGQLLLTRQKLVSSISISNHSSGMFQLAMQEDGNLVLYSSGFPEIGGAYWSTETIEAGGNVTLNMKGNGQLYLANTTGLNFKDLYNGGNFKDKIILRMTIEADGLLRLYSHSFDQNGDWSIEWSPVNNKCDPKGVCGLNAYCTLINQDPVCSCPFGFDFIDQEHRNLGCRRIVKVDGCLNRSDNTNYFLSMMEGIAWEDNPYSVITNVANMDCRDNCLRDCDCEAALFKNQECRKQKFPLRFGKRELVQQVTTFVKVGRGSPGASVASKERKKVWEMGILITGAALLTIAFIVIVISGFFVYKYRVLKYKKVMNHGNEELIEDVTLRPFSYAELEKATNSFMDEVGKGAFGTVFKGAISDGKRVVAVKRLEKVVAEGERDFRNEMKAIGRTHHRNLVQLLGYCHDESNRLLVYEYMSNGSLADFLFESDKQLHWEERIGIALSIARGILYLHDECHTQIIHCDIKPENILLDQNRCAKIADFGLAKLLMPNQTRTHTGIRGTRGYVAPEWYKNLPITVKVDVYSFGIMLLEIICCRRSIDMDVPDDEAILADYVYDCFHASELDKLVQDEEVDKIKLERMVRVGLWCIQEEPSLRPRMKKVVLMLEGTVEIPAPPSPSSFFSST